MDDAAPVRRAAGHDQPIFAALQNAGTARLLGTVTVNASGGVAAFGDLAVDKVGSSYFLNFADSGVIPGSSVTFNITAGAPAVEVEAVDAYGNVATGFTGTIRLALEVNAHGAVLAGTTSAGATAGVASFDTLSVAATGTGYSLVASAAGLSPASSGTFDVSTGLPTRYELLGLPASSTVGVQVAFSVRALDASDNVSTDYAGTATISSTDAALTKPASVSFASGVALNVPVTFHTTGVANGAVAAGTTLASIAIRVDGLEIGTGTALPFSAQWDTKDLEKKSAHQITAVIRDAAGNVVQSVPVTVTIAQSGCGCGATSGGEASILFGLAVALQIIRRRRRAAPGAELAASPV